MSLNTNIDPLDAVVIAQRTYDANNDAVRVSVGSAEFTVDGQSLSVNGTITNGSSGQVIPATPCAGITQFQLYAVATTATTGSVTVAIAVSPDPTANIFYTTSTTLTMGASSINTIDVSSILSTIIAQQVKVTITSNSLSAGQTVTVYLVGNSF